MYERSNHVPPPDLAEHFREFRPGAWGYVCPCCKNVFCVGLAGMPGAFRTHIKEIPQGLGCFFRPNAKPKVRLADKAVDF